MAACVGRPGSDSLACVARVWIAALALLAAACGPGSPPGSSSLPPSETFNWSGQAIAFAPPPDGWRREGNTSGGIKGARFVKERSVGEGIDVGEYYRVGERDRRAALQALIDGLDAHDPSEFRKALSLARSRTDDPFSDLEAEVAEGVNAALDRALSAYVNRDVGEARTQLGAALLEAERLRFPLDDVIDAVIFAPERRQEPTRFTLVERRDTQIAGEQAVVVDYTMQQPERLFHGREAYVVHNGHLFVAKFFGRKESLPVFDRVVASIRFPR